MIRRALVVLAVITGLLPAPAALAGTSHATGAALPHRYVVLTKPGVDPAAVAADHHHRLHARIRYVYRRAVQGFAASISPAAARAVLRDPRVASVEPDRRVRVSGLDWGLDRIDQRAPRLDGRFAPAGTGAGVTVYVIDTGIRFSHRDLAGRAVSRYDAVDGGRADDCNGHGTHVAGTIGGASFGVAKAVRLVAVRVLDCSGAGPVSAIVAGVEWVTAHHRPGDPAVANMSLGGARSPAIDQAVNRSIAEGVTYVVAAGNDGADACADSPSHIPAAITVAATGPDDQRAPWSDFGPCVDLFAPGVGIRSAWRSSDTATRVLSGTSMASPHVAGAAAVYLGAHRGATPRQVADALLSSATARVVGDPRSPHSGLVYVGA